MSFNVTSIDEVVMRNCPSHCPVVAGIGKTMEKELDLEEAAKKKSEVSLVKSHLYISSTALIK